MELGDRLFYYLCGNTYWPLCDTYCLHSLHSFNLSPASVSTDSPLLPIPISLKSQLLWSVSDFTVKAFPVLLFSTVSVNKGYINSNIVLLSLVFWSTFWLNLI